MAVATLVPLALENEHKKSDLTFNQKHLSHESSRVNSPPYRIGELKTSDMVNFKQRIEAEGIFQKAAKLITIAEGQVDKLVTNRPGISGLASVNRDKLILFDAL